MQFFTFIDQQKIFLCKVYTVYKGQSRCHESELRHIRRVYISPYCGKIWKNQNILLLQIAF